jgi:hypothetical protein
LISAWRTALVSRAWATAASSVRSAAEQAVGEAAVDGELAVHPGLGVHPGGDLGGLLPVFSGVDAGHGGVERLQPGGGLGQLVAVAHGQDPAVVDHEEAGRADQDLGRRPWR